MVGIDLSDNLLHGEIPEALFRQKNIEYLNLSYNFLEGQLPRLEKLPRLKALDLSHNSLSGQVTGNVSTPPGLTLLNLSHNCFSGIVTEKEGLGKFPGALVGNGALCGIFRKQV
ncbi:hypothetical protein Bca52824_052170 [Brassica carinata]|uniref:Uncharacterized protein n=1 Tax=Brassica carinata TaxID=52824 RepID=A0A8X7UIH2_BRACI|nr:hypothetical protein Bca52824_052170 [Brassica carinata]